MNSKRQIATQRQKTRRRLWIFALVVPLVVGAAVVFTTIVSYKKPPNLTRAVIPVQQPVPKITYDSNSAKKLAEDLFAECFPSLPKNSYFPQFAKEKLNEIFTENKAGRFVVDVEMLSNPYNQASMMSCSHSGEERGLTIYAPRVYWFLRHELGLASGWNQLAKNTFMIGAVHEMTHWEKPNFILLNDNKKSHEQLLNEECRVWAKVDRLVVKQLREQGQPMVVDLLEVDDVLKSCNYQEQCPKLRSYLDENSPVANPPQKQ